MNPHARLVIIAGLLSPVACGGGGGDDQPNFAGVWSGSVSLVQNSCPREIPVQYLSFLHQVKQNPDPGAFNAIVLDDGAELYGSGGALLQPDSFAVYGDPQPLPDFFAGESCNEALTWRYESVDTENGVAGFVVRKSQISCDSVQCEVTYTGSAYRTPNGGQQPCCYTVDSSSGGGTTGNPEAGIPIDATNPLTGS